MNNTILIKNAFILDPNNFEDKKQSLLIKDDLIAEISDEIDENIIFNRLNARVLQIFPQIAYEEELYFHTMIYTLKKCDYWVTTSKTYYNEIMENPKLSGKMYKHIIKTKNKSGYVYYGKEMKDFPLEGRKVYESFNSENFREQRNKNKAALLKEFNINRIENFKSKGFTDITDGIDLINYTITEYSKEKLIFRILVNSF